MAPLLIEQPDTTTTGLVAVADPTASNAYIRLSYLGSFPMTSSWSTGPGSCTRITRRMIEMMPDFGQSVSGEITTSTISAWRMLASICAATFDREGAFDETRTSHSDPQASLRAALERIEEFAALPADWDSYGADPVSTTSIDVARRFLAHVGEKLGSLVSDRIQPYAIAPLANGGIQVEWRGPGGELEVEIGADGDLGYLVVTRQGADLVYEEQDCVTWLEVIDVLSRVLISRVAM